MVSFNDTIQVEPYYLDNIKKLTKPSYPYTHPHNVDKCKAKLNELYEYNKINRYSYKLEKCDIKYPKSQYPIEEEITRKTYTNLKKKHRYISKIKKYSSRLFLKKKYVFKDKILCNQINNVLNETTKLINNF